jgi:ABC-type uncharacterized transport system ATPase subunit
MNGEAPQLAEVLEARREEDGAWRLLLAPGVTPAAVLEQLVRRGAQVNRFEKVLTPMEDIFINVVEGVRP